MTPIIYAENETDFSHNGIGLLVDTIYCYPEEARNSDFEVEVAYPIFSRMYKEIKANRWIKAKANDRFEPQLFRIYFISKPINGKITVKAEHISYLLKDNFIESLNYTGGCNGVLNALNSAATFSTGFTFASNVSGSKNFAFDLRNFWECIIGKDDSIISQFGTGIDIVRNNKNISLLSNGGQDNNVLIAYKKNLTGFTLEEDWTNTITKIYPYATQNDVRIILPEKYVNSQYINRDSSPRVSPIDFTNEFSEGETITADALRQKAINYFINTQCDIPSLNYNIEFVALSKTEEYKNFAMNEVISLLDYVIVRHELYGIDTKIKVVKAKYDSLAEKYLKLELGFVKNTITNLIKNTNKKIDDNKKETDQKVDDTKAELKDNIDEAKKEATEATSNLQVVLEKKDTEIEASVTNEVENRKTAILVQDGKIDERVKSKDFEAYQTITDGEIADRVSKGADFYAEMLIHPDAIVETIHSATDNKTVLDRNGLRVVRGGFTFEDDNGDEILSAYTGGGVRIGDDSWDSELCLERIRLGNKQLASYFQLSHILINTELKMDGYNIYTEGTIYSADLEVSGSKHCVQQTESYGKRLINAYETAGCYYGDIGSGTIKNGECLVLIDQILLECINTDVEYHIEIFEYKNRGSITEVERHINYFIVKGSINGIEFGWELKAKRKGYENNRLESSKN